MNTGLPTAPLASGLIRAGGGAVDNPCNGASTTRSRSTYLSPGRVQTSGATSASQYRVTAQGREVRSWDQPLVRSDGVGRIVLACQRRGGVLKFLVHAEHEPGYLEGVQLSPSVSLPPGEALARRDKVRAQLCEMIDEGRRARVHLCCRQSEEGGRFYQDENVYQVAEIDGEIPLSPLYRWLTLRQIRELSATPGALTIELRCALSLLLSLC